MIHFQENSSWRFYEVEGGRKKTCRDKIGIALTTHAAQQFLASKITNRLILNYFTVNYNKHFI